MPSKVHLKKNRAYATSSDLRPQIEKSRSENVDN